MHNLQVLTITLELDSITGLGMFVRSLNVDADSSFENRLAEVVLLSFHGLCLSLWTTLG